MRLILFLSALLTGLAGALSGGQARAAHPIERVAAALSPRIAAAAEQRQAQLRPALLFAGPPVAAAPVHLAPPPHVDVRSKVDSALE